MAQRGVRGRAFGAWRRDGCATAIAWGHGAPSSFLGRVPLRFACLDKLGGFCRRLLNSAYSIVEVVGAGLDPPLFQGKALPEPLFLETLLRVVGQQHPAHDCRFYITRVDLRVPLVADERGERNLLCSQSGSF